jgi:hypothetical protein
MMASEFSKRSLEQPDLLSPLRDLYEWHDLTLTPKDGGEPIHRRDRYVDVWRRNKEGNWKLWMYMENQDVADPFRPEQTIGRGTSSRKFLKLFVKPLAEPARHLKQLPFVDQSYDISAAVEYPVQCPRILKWASILSRFSGEISSSR